MYEDLKTQLADKLCINSDSFDLIGITEVQFGIGQEVGREGRKDGTNAPVIKTCSSFFLPPSATTMLFMVAEYYFTSIKLASEPPIHAPQVYFFELT